MSLTCGSSTVTSARCSALLAYHSMFAGFCASVTTESGSCGPDGRVLSQVEPARTTTAATATPAAHRCRRCRVASARATTSSTGGFRTGITSPASRKTPVGSKPSGRSRAQSAPAPSCEMPWRSCSCTTTIGWASTAATWSGSRSAANRSTSTVRASSGSRASASSSAREQLHPLGPVGQDRVEQRRRVRIVVAAVPRDAAVDLVEHHAVDVGVHVAVVPDPVPRGMAAGQPGHGCLLGRLGVVAEEHQRADEGWPPRDHEGREVGTVAHASSLPRSSNGLRREAAHACRDMGP